MLFWGVVRKWSLCELHSEDCYSPSSPPKSTEVELAVNFRHNFFVWIEMIIVWSWVEIKSKVGALPPWQLRHSQHRGLSYLAAISLWNARAQHPSSPRQHCYSPPKPTLDTRSLAYASNIAPSFPNSWKWTNALGLLFTELVCLNLFFAALSFQGLSLQCSARVQKLLCSVKCDTSWNLADTSTGSPVLPVLLVLALIRKQSWIPQWTSRQPAQNSPQKVEQGTKSRVTNNLNTGGPTHWPKASWCRTVKKMKSCRSVDRTPPAPLINCWGSFARWGMTFDSRVSVK